MRGLACDPSTLFGFFLYSSITRSLFSQSRICLSFSTWLSTCEVLLYSWVHRSRVFRSMFWSIITLLHLARFWRSCLTMPSRTFSSIASGRSPSILNLLLSDASSCREQSFDTAQLLRYSRGPSFKQNNSPEPQQPRPGTAQQPFLSLIKRPIPRPSFQTIQDHDGQPANTRQEIIVALLLFLQYSYHPLDCFRRSLRGVRPVSRPSSQKERNLATVLP